MPRVYSERAAENVRRRRPPRRRPVRKPAWTRPLRETQPLRRFKRQQRVVRRREARRVLAQPGAPRPPIRPRLKQPTRRQAREVSRARGRFQGRALRYAQRQGVGYGAAQREVDRRLATRDRTVKRYEQARARLQQARRLSYAQSVGYRTAGEYARANRATPGRAGGTRGAGGELQVAGISLPSAERKLLGSQSFVGRLANIANAEKGEGLGVRLARDLASLPANVVVGGYYTGKAGAQAAGGDSRALKQIGRDLVNTSPVILAARGKFKEAAKSASEHPGLAAAEVIPGGMAASRVAGRAGRVPTQGVRGSKVGRPRRPRRVAGTKLEERRRYPRGIVGERAAIASDKRKRRRTVELTERAHGAVRRGDREEADRLYAAAARKDPDRVPESYIERRIDQREGLYQSQRRPGRSQTAMATRQALETGIPGKRRPFARAAAKTGRSESLVSLVAQGIVRPDRGDLKAYRDELVAAQPQLSSRAKKRANRATVADIDRVLASKTDPAELLIPARAVGRVQAPLERVLVQEKVLDKDQAERARLLPAAARTSRAGAQNVKGVGIVPRQRVAEAEQVAQALPVARRRVTQDPSESNVQALRDLEGRKRELVMTSPALRREAADQGDTEGPRLDVEDISFASHAPTNRSSGSYNVSGRRPQGIPAGARTGAAVREGTLDPSAERLVEQNVRMRGLADAVNHWKGTVDELGVRDKDGRVRVMPSKKEALDAAADAKLDDQGRPLPGSHDYVPVKASPWAGNPDQLQKLLDDADPEGWILDEDTPRHPVSEAIRDALEGKGEGGDWVLMPRAAAQRQLEHANVVASQPPLGRFVTQAFRQTVLPLSPSWLTGNIAEGTLRTIVHGATPRDWLFFHKTYKELARMDPKKAEEMIHRLPGGHFGGVHDTMIYSSAKQFQSSRLAPLARAMARLRRTPAPREVANVWKWYTDHVFGTWNPAIESQFTRAMAGKYMREHLVSKKDIDTMGTAVEQAARGSTNTNEMAAMADVLRRAYGQYDSFSPKQRRFLLHYSPFGAWTWNAIKFVTSVLPRDHPALVAALAANQRLSEDWRKERGLDFWAEKSLPFFLQGSIPLPGGGHLRAARYTPFGFWGSPLETLSANIMPQVSGPLMTMKGLDWKGQPIRKKGGDKETDPLKLGLIAAREFMFATVPGVGLSVRLGEKGPSTLNPVKPVKPSKKKAPKTLDDEIDAILKEAEGGGLDEEMDKILKKAGY